MSPDRLDALELQVAARAIQTVRERAYVIAPSGVFFRNLPLALDLSSSVRRSAAKLCSPSDSESPATPGGVSF
jgi:hypothetical protein